MSRPYGIDDMGHHDRLMRYFRYRDGFFLEIGGNDGYFHSPTYYMERFLGWRGILVEPVAELARRCIKERPKSSVYNFACVGRDSPNDVDFINCGHSSHVSGSVDEAQPWIADIQQRLRPEERILRVKATTIATLLEEHFVAHDRREIDLFVLDVEGYEIVVLEGFDFMKHSPKFILIENHSLEEFTQKDMYLAERNYRLVERISENDYLYKRQC